MPNYTKHGKILLPLTTEKFIQGMNEGHFCKRAHRGLASLLYHTGVRISEALRARKKQFSLQSDVIFFDVLKRLKHGRLTPPLQIPLSKPFASEIWTAVEQTKAKRKVWPYCRVTGFNIVARVGVFYYPHHFRLTKITNLAREFSPAHLINWTGLTLTAINYYIGLVDIEKMGRA